MKHNINLSEVTPKKFLYKNRKVVPSQEYAKFCGKETKEVNQTIQRLTNRKRLTEGIDYFHIPRKDMVTAGDHEMVQYVDSRYGGYFIPRKTVNALSHYYDDMKSITLSSEVNDFATLVQEDLETKDPIIAASYQIASLRREQIKMQEEQEDIKERQRDLEIAQLRSDLRLDSVEETVKKFDSDTGYRTVTAYNQAMGKPLPLNEAQKVGRRASAKCREQGLSTGKVSCERHGSVKSYPIAVLKEVYEELGLN